MTDILHSCATCKHLSICEDVTEDKLESNFCCTYWASLDDIELLARENMILDFGVLSLGYESKSIKLKHLSTKQRRRRRRNG